MSVSKAVLITGCSSGIGRATAERLAGVGWKVYTTARNVEAIPPLAERGCELLQLDVTDEGSMRAAAGSMDGPEEDGPYAGFETAVTRATAKNHERGPLLRLGGGPEAVAGKIEEAISARQPRSRYTATPSAHLFLWLRRLLPDGAWDAVLRSSYPQPGR